MCTVLKQKLLYIWLLFLHTVQVKQILLKLDWKFNLRSYANLCTVLDNPGARPWKTLCVCKLTWSARNKFIHTIDTKYTYCEKCSYFTLTFSSDTAPIDSRRVRLDRVRNRVLVYCTLWLPYCMHNLNANMLWTPKQKLILLVTIIIK